MKGDFHVRFCENARVKFPFVTRLAEINKYRLTTSMNFELIYAAQDYKDVIKNLIQFYIYDFSEYINFDVEEDGLFKAYPDLEAYWKERDNKFPYIIKKDEKYVGFVLVK